MRFSNGAELPGYNPSDYFEPKEASMLDRFAQFAVIAAREAVRGSGWREGSDSFRDAVVVTGSCVGGQSTQDAGFVDLYLRGQPRISPMVIPRTMSNAGASAISREHGIQGAVYNVSTACSSSNHAIGQAFWMVRQGIADLAVTGGSEAPFSMGFLKAWEAMRVVSPDTCRPFSVDRRGMILGEGAGMLVLESLDAARARGATIHAEIVGFGMSSDAHHLTQPTLEGPVRAMRAALTDGELEPGQIDYVNAHGTGTPANDATESAAIRELFGDHSDRLPVSSTKSLHGHALGAAGGLEAVATILALREGFLPPTANWTAPDPACNLDVVVKEAREARPIHAISNSFAFGGLNAVLAFRAPQAV